jgi:hypothetical protein
MDKVLLRAGSAFAAARVGDSENCSVAAGKMLYNRIQLGPAGINL